MRHISNFRMYARGLPQRLQRLYLRTANRGFAAAFRISAFFATVGSYFRNGTPSSVKRASASSSVLASVTMVMFIPRILLILS